MRIIKSLKEAYWLFRFYRLRFIFSLMGVIVAIASLSALMVMNNSIKENARQLLKKYGESRFVVNIAPSSEKEKKKFHSLLTPEGAMDLNKQLNPNYQLMPYQAVSVSSYLNAKKLDAMIIATTPMVFNLLDWQIEKGRKLHVLDAWSKVAIIGQDVAQNMRDWEINLGGQYFKVVGVMAYKEYNPMLDFDVNKSIIIHLNMLPKFPYAHYIDSFIVEGKGCNLIQCEDEFKVKFKKLFDSENILIRDASIYQKALENQVKLTVQILKIIVLVTLFLALCSLINLFIILIDDRKKEIGLRYALGGTFKMVSIQILTEISLLTLIGGIIGSVLGNGIAFLIISHLGLNLYQDLFTWIIGLPLALLISLLAGILPLIFISKRDPITLIHGAH